MTETTCGSSSIEGAAPLVVKSSALTVIRITMALLVSAGLLGGAYWLHISPEQGATASFSLLIGAALGVVFMRGRFCFFCILRDYIEYRNSGPMYALLAALAVGGVGYAIVFGAFLPNAMSGRLPPDAHIGPISPVLFGAGLAFGLGMALSGACISGHLYRLGEGYSRAPIALFGSLLGFGLGFFTWNELYLTTIAHAPTAWLPAYLGYAGALAIHLLLLGLLALLFLPDLPERPAQPAYRLTLSGARDLLLYERWHPLASGALVGLIGVFAYFRVEPLGVTSQLGSLSRTTLNQAGLLPPQLYGLDTLAGCATQVVQTITENGWLVIGLIFGSFAVALLANGFQLSRLTVKNSSTALLGGVLMGWGAMTALGCTVGTLLSGISAFALSGWVFGGAVFIGVWLGVRLRLHQ